MSTADEYIKGIRSHRHLSTELLVTTVSSCHYPQPQCHRYRPSLCEVCFSKSSCNRTKNKILTKHTSFSVTVFVLSCIVSVAERRIFKADVLAAFWSAGEPSLRSEICFPRVKRSTISWPVLGVTRYKVTGEYLDYFFVVTSSETHSFCNSSNQFVLKKH